MTAMFSMLILNSPPKSTYVEGIITFVAASAVIFAGAIIARQAIRGSPKFAWIREKAVFWAATGGTSFYSEDLTDACFDGADLRHTDFRKANLTRTSFKGATGLELARLQGTILENPKVRKLLTNNNGYGEDFTEANLYGANLRKADLREAILVKAQLLNADLSGAFLTNACIQDWNINHNTRFENVDCQRVYLKCSHSGHFLEPKPDSGEFQPGEFEKWITDVRDTIDLIFQNGLNWRAFAFSLTQTALNNEGVDLSVRSIENKGDGVVVAKVGVSLETNKTALHEEITNHYHEAVKAIEAKYQLVLQAKDGEIERLRNFYDSQQYFIQGLITSIAEPRGKVLIQGESNRVYMMNQAGDIMENNNEGINIGGNVGGNIDTGDKISVGGDMNLTASSLTGSLNNVTNTIQQLSDIKTESSDQLAKILTILQKSITEDSVLSDSQKEEALEAVETIAEEGKKPQEQRTVKFCKMALNALNGVAATVTDASKLAEALKNYLPMLTKLLGI
ncbi:MAG: pentapeptide repeat-containing protein [Iphinoe sp. HA4291-MV1]|jgi:uncharacterized protein YjbI with pentapeptide repeats|nr:pentapeptide repeat-containing protein [Iphinoe sp. HA4291-MV1]